MPVLQNPKHEKFAQLRAKGKTAEEAYDSAGYKPHRGNASRLSTNESVLARVAEIQGRAAERAAVTIQSLTDELDEVRALAIAEKQSSAAVSAVMGKAKLHGLLIDKKRLEGPNGGPVKIDLTNLPQDEIERLISLFGHLASVSDDDAEDATGGEG